MTPEEIAVQLRHEWAGGIPVTINGMDTAHLPWEPEYDERIAEMVRFVLDAQDAAAAEEARLTLKRKYRWARNAVDTHLPILIGPPAPTAAQVRNATRDMLMMWDGLLDVLRDARIILDDDET